MGVVNECNGLLASVIIPKRWQPEDQIIAIVAEAAGVDDSAINVESEMWRDLHIGGDDMLELFLRLQEQFWVNLDGLDLKNFCPNEDDALLTQSPNGSERRLASPRNALHINEGRRSHGCGGIEELER